jgi:AcrR family transcriptional regulator
MSRPYASELRAEMARQTRRRILAAAERELLSAGYHATTMASLARAAGVSPQTIYDAIGGKAAVVKAVYDVLLAGDDDPIAMSERPEMKRALAQRTVAATLLAYAGVGRLIMSRVGPVLVLVLAEGAGAELRDFLATIDRERRIGNTAVVRHIAERFGLPNGLSLDRAIDHVWTLTAPDVADRLVRRCGWTWDDYEGWLAAQLMAGFGQRTRPVSRAVLPRQGV